MLEVRESEQSPPDASPVPPADPSGRRRQVVLALGLAGVVLLVAASVAAITWKPAGSHRTDRVTTAAPAPPAPPAPGPVGEVPTTVVAVAPSGGGSPVAGPTPVARATPTPARVQGSSPPMCTLASGYPLTIPEAITTGPDGALWFTQPGVARVGRLTTSGAYSAFPVSDVPGSNNGIATGSDGALWFSQRTAIGRMTTSGDVKSYVLPNAAQPGRMVAGPDRAVWFVETNRPVVGRITPSGDFTEVRLPGDQPAKGIVAGPDGALWVARGSILRVSVAGDVTEHPVAQFPDSGAQPEVATGGMAVGRDGAIWFVTQFALHRMTVDGHDTIESGVSASQSTQTRSPQTDIAADGNGDFWISTIAIGGSQGSVQWVSGQSPQDTKPAKAYPGDAPIAITTGPSGAVFVGTSPSTAKGPPYGPSAILRLTTDGTAVVKALPCPS